MSTHASTKIDQKEYLKKYLSGDKGKKKKKTKKHKTKATVRIIDDDLSTLETGQQIDEDLLLGGDDAPQIVGEYIQEGPSGSEASKWRNIAVKLEDESDEEDGGEKKVKPQTEADLWGCKSSNIKIKDEFSPPRRKKGERRQHTPDISPPRRREEDNGHSPPRRKERKRRSKSRDKKEKSPKRRQRSRTLSSDQSPPRKARQSPVRRKRKDSSEDNSPVRKRRDSPQRSRNRSRDQSPPRRQRKDSSDQSPPRRRNSDQSPPRRRAQSPAKSHRKRSPERLSSRRRNLDQSPPRKRQPSISPTRIKREKQTPDHSPQRKPKIKRESLSPPPEPQRRSRWAKAEPTKSPSPPPTHKPKATKTLEGKKAGLQNAQDMQVETAERRRREERHFAEMSSDISGRDAEVQVRSTGRRGQRARDAAAEDPEVRRRKEEHEALKKERYDRWGKGLKQVEDHRSRMVEQEYESSKPLARYSNDEDLDRHLRDQERADDPMLEYMRQKKKDRVQTKGPSLPVYQGSYPENRFGIRPGYRWDGVDRSNGYEKQWFDVQSAKRAGQEEAYKYSVEDM